MHNDLPPSCRADEQERWLLSAAVNGAPQAIDRLKFSTELHCTLAEVIRKAPLARTPDDRMIVMNQLNGHPQKNDLLALLNDLAPLAIAPSLGVIESCRSEVENAAELRLAWDAFEKGRTLIRNGDAETFLDNLPALLGTIESRRQKKPFLDLASCLISAAQLDKLTIPKRKRLLGKWLCEGDLGYIFAPRGVGKTWLAMAVPAAISQMIPLGQWEAGEAEAQVLYVDGEMPLELTQYRSRGLGKGSGDVAYLHHETLFEKLGASLNIGLAAHREAITELLLSGGFKLLILDNLSALASGIVENRGEDYEPIASWLLELRRRKITVIVVHHAGRNGLMRGHTKREDACSWIIELKDLKGEGDSGAKFVSHFAKPSRNTAEAMPDLLWHFTTDTGGTTSIHCEPSAATEYEAFIQHVLDGIERVTDIAERMGKPRGTISKWATKAASLGRIKKDGRALLPPNALSKEAINGS